MRSGHITRRDTTPALESLLPTNIKLLCGNEMSEDLSTGHHSNPQQDDPCKYSKSIELASIPVDIRDAIDDSLRNFDQMAVVEDYLLHCLTFNTMGDREDEISVAHEATFSWVLNEDAPSNSLTSWLKDGLQKVYWINGKPGSGKSTLMRFVYENPKTMEILKVWAAEKSLICPRFFFWTSGTIEQKSTSGLLRSLLYQLLQHFRELIPWVFSDFWLKYQDARVRVREPIAWSVELLWPALLRLLKLSNGVAKICFFIDGLDELEGN